jgi:hypothetical protein
MTIAVGFWTLSDSGLRSLYVRVRPPTVIVPCAIEPAIDAAVRGAAVGGADAGYDPQPQRKRPTRTAAAENRLVARWRVMKVTRLPSRCIL